MADRSIRRAQKAGKLAPKTIQDLKKHLGVEIDTEMLLLALTHRSFTFEFQSYESNERLEFLGDSVLGIIVTDYIYRSYPKDSEAELAKKRSSIVSTVALAEVARRIELGQHIFLGKGERMGNVNDKDSVLADTVEALIGATYLDQGMESAKNVVHKHVIPLLQDERIMGAAQDWKTVVRMAIEQANLGEIEYTSESVGPDHNRTFSSTLLVDGKPLGSGTAKTKKEAERLAAWRSVDAIEKLTNA